MKRISKVLAVVALAMMGNITNVNANNDDGAIIETMDGTVQHVDLENHQLVVADFVYAAPRSVPVRRGSTRLIGLDKVKKGDRVVLRMPPNQRWAIPMPIAEIEILR